MVHTQKITVPWIREAKVRGRPIAALTAYDYPTARLLDEAGIDILLVGDSVGMAMLGFPDTTQVTIEHMVHHTSAVARAKPKALLVADLPYHTYSTPEAALANAQRLIAAGAEAVKLEGGAEKELEIQALLQAGIPVMGHLGMLPQSIVVEGGIYRIKGKTIEEQSYLHHSMEIYTKLGVFATVLELVQAEVARKLTENFSLPTIGIGSGQDCYGQILVTPDLIGLSPWFRPKFVVPEANVANQITQAVVQFKKRTGAS